MHFDSRTTALLSLVTVFGLQAPALAEDSSFSGLASKAAEVRTCGDSHSVAIAAEWLRVLPVETLEILQDPVVKRAAYAAKRGKIDDSTKRAAQRMLASVVATGGIVDKKAINRAIAKVRSEFKTTKIPNLGEALRSEERGAELTIGAVMQAIPSNPPIQCGKEFRKYLVSIDQRISQIPIETHKTDVPYVNAIQQTNPGTDAPGTKYDTPGNQCGVEANNHFQPLPSGRVLGTYDSIGFPEVVFLKYETGKTCTGTLLSPSWVLTAAHCVLHEGGEDDYETLRVWLNQGFANAHQGNSSRASVKKNRVFVLPQYLALSTRKVDSETKASYDIALIELDKAFDVPLQFAVWTNKPPDTFLATLAGYGPNLSDKPNSDDTNNTLDVGWLKVAANPDMVRWVGYAPLENDAEMNSVVCLGDSGGPIFLNAWKGTANSNTPNPRPTLPAVGCQDERRQLVGVVSFRKPMEGKPPKKETPFCSQLTSGGGAAVSPHLKWICEKTGLYCENN